MGLAEHPVVMEPELLPRAQLAFTGVAGEAGQVVDVVSRPPHPVRGRDASGTLGTGHAERSEGEAGAG